MSRRDLRFSALGDVKTDVLHLHSHGYQPTGNWDLSQIANHLSDWISFPMDGFPKLTFPLSLLIGIMRVTQGKSLYRKFVQTQRMPSNQPTLRPTIYAKADQAQSVDRLLSSLDRLSGFRGAIHPSPLFGALDYDEMVALQLAHCAHHLSFLKEPPR